MLALPDGDALLDAIDEEAAGPEGLVAVGGAGGAEDRGVADLEGADAVLHGEANAGDLALDPGDDALHLGDGHGRVRFVLEERGGEPLVVVTNDPEEGGDAAGAGVRDEGEGLVEGERSRAKRSPRHGRSPRRQRPERPPSFCSSWRGPMTTSRCMPFTIS